MKFSTSDKSGHSSTSIKEEMEDEWMESPNGLAQFARVFGEGVIENVFEKVKEHRPDATFNDNGTTNLELDYTDIIVQLSNGRFVQLWTSEWGGADLMEKVE